jgi:hypothetical protein
MHAVIAHVKIDPGEEDAARKMLSEVVVPMTKGFSGFSGGTWCRALEGDRGISVLLFETEQAARAAAEQMLSEGPPPGMPVTRESVDVFEVLAQA